MKEHVVLVVALLVRWTQGGVGGGGGGGGGLYFTKSSCTSFEPTGPGVRIAMDIMRVEFHPPTFQPGQPFTLTISSTEDVFANAFLRTVCESCTDKYDRIGQFVRSDTRVNFYDCDGHNASAVNANSYTDRDLFTVKWVPDPDMTERFHFIGSMVVNISHWYTGYKSETFFPPESAGASSREDTVFLYGSIMPVLLPFLKQIPETF